MTDAVQTSALEEPDKGGRPPFEPTDKQRREVAIAAGGGMTHEQIAAALGISPPTLRKHFPQELIEVASKRRIEALNKLYRVGMKGNVSALKAYIAAGEAANAAPAALVEPKPEKIGKKDQAEQDAKTAQVGTEWGELLPGGAPPTVQ